MPSIENVLCGLLRQEERISNRPHPTFKIFASTMLVSVRCNSKSSYFALCPELLGSRQENPISNRLQATFRGRLGVGVWAITCVCCTLCTLCEASKRWNLEPSGKLLRKAPSLDRVHPFTPASRHPHLDCSLFPVLSSLYKAHLNGFNPTPRIARRALDFHIQYLITPSEMEV